MTPTSSHNDAAAAHTAGHDSSFDSFIDSNLILDASSPAPSTPTKAHREMQKLKVTPLSALPTRLSEAASHHNTTIDSPTAPDFLSYSHPSSSTVTTPTTSNSSTLHNLNFDFFDSHASGQSTNDGPSFTSASETLAPVTTFGDSPLQPDASSASNHVFAWNAPLYPMQMTHSFSRSVDDLEHGINNHQATAAHNHQRSLSLRDVAPPSACDSISTDSLTMLPFPLVKMEQDLSADFVGSFADNAPSPMTEDRSSPSSSAVSSSLFEHGSPRLDKKRRLASPSESMTSTMSNKSAKSTPMARSSTGSIRKSSGASKRSRASTLTNKGNNGVVSAAPSTATIGLGFNPTSLVENAATDQSMQLDSTPHPPMNVSGYPQHQFSGQQESRETPLTAEGNNGQAEGSDSAAPKSNNKRPPPSASQITESGQPFPVIDTSAKHSSLFVPPDTSGLTKREARLVKNRAAAFLSRQRKREQFEELEIKCQSLCRLVWRFWEIVAGPNQEINFVEKYSQTRILPIVLEEEADEVREVLEMVVALKGGSVAPTEDGQLQGAMAAGISSANGKLINSTSSSPKASLKNLSTAKSPTENSEVVRLQMELQESKKREAALQAELAQERSMRMNESYNNPEARKPFKGGKQEEALSLTISPKFEADDVEVGEDVSKRQLRGRGNARQGPSRTSERLQRQQSQMSLSSANSTAVSTVNGGQRKAAGAALMMVLFSFALFGLPGGQIPRAGGMTRVGTAEDFSVGKVLGAPLSGAQYSQEEDEEVVDYDLTGKQAPSSHLSAKDLLPPMPDMSDLINLEDGQMDEEAEQSSRQNIHHSFRNVLNSSQGDDEDASVDYQAFARDLGASLDWDVQRGFIVIGSDHDRDDTEDSNGNNVDQDVTKENSRGKAESASNDAPTKLTLFVPAPDMSGEGMETEDRFYDAPLASADASTILTSSTVSGRGGKGEQDENSSHLAKDLTQAEATRAALRVLRNHRVAQEAAALATSRRLSQKPRPSHRVGSSHSRKEEQDNQSSSSSKATSSKGKGRASYGNDLVDSDIDATMDLEPEEEQDYSKDVMDATSTTDKIRGTDFYQLEFSLSGAKVRNVAELAKLLGVVRNKKE